MAAETLGRLPGRRLDRESPDVMEMPHNVESSVVAPAWAGNFPKLAIGRRSGSTCRGAGFVLAEWVRLLLQEAQVTALLLRTSARVDL
jgi:hypothetical protein